MCAPKTVAVLDAESEWSKCDLPAPPGPPGPGLWRGLPSSRLGGIGASLPSHGGRGTLSLSVAKVDPSSPSPRPAQRPVLDEEWPV